MDSWAQISKIRHPSRPALFKIGFVLKNTLISRRFWRIFKRVSNSFRIVSKSNRIDTLWLVEHYICSTYAKQSYSSALKPKNARQMCKLCVSTVSFDPLRFVHAHMCSLDQFSNNRHFPIHVSIIIEVVRAKSFSSREFTTIFKNSCKFVRIWIENVSNWHRIAIRQLSMHNICQIFIYGWFEPKKCISDASIKP
jgi:hypothetical protein